MTDAAAGNTNSGKLVHVLEESGLIRFCPLCAASLERKNRAGRMRVCCSACDFVHWENPKLAAVVVVPVDGGIVMTKRCEPPAIGFWCLPGGFVEALEPPEIAAAREVLEETGLQVEIDRLLAARAVDGANIVVLYYVARSLTSVILAPADDAEEAKVFSLNDLPEAIAFPHDRQMIDEWFASQGATPR
jgi:ADP-ribose pyrophosphatase YjhB (NUDIX family)